MRKEECRECDYWNTDYGCMNNGVCILEDQTDRLYDKWVDDHLINKEDDNVHIKNSNWWCSAVPAKGSLS